MICILAAGLLFASRCIAGEDLDLKEVLPQAGSFKPVNKGTEVIYYKAEDKSGKLMGAVFKASGKSYGGNIDTLVGMLKDGTITAIKVLLQNETPGIGSRITEPEFTGRVRDIKDISRVQAITGATVSSQVVIESVKKKAEEIKQLMEGAE